MNGTHPLRERIAKPFIEAGECMHSCSQMLAGIRFSPTQAMAVLQQTYLVGRARWSSS